MLRVIEALIFMTVLYVRAYSVNGPLFLVCYGKKVREVNKRDSVTFAVGSVTNAMRGRALLSQNGISSAVGRARPDERTGCGYTLTVTEEAERALRLLNAAGIRVRSAP